MKSPKEIKESDTVTWRISSTVGKGGFGNVYAASCGDKQVAIKVCDIERAKRVKVFKHEATIMRKLQHPNIISFVSFFENEHVMAICMELCDTVCMRDIHEHMEVKEEHVANWMTQLCYALK